jgi:transcription elongation factor GreA
MRGGLESDEDTVGDRGDAADEVQLADQVAGIDDRINELEWLLRGGSPPSQTDTLPDGTEVTLRFADTGVVKMRVIAVVAETPAGEQDDTLTADSPLGLALVGHQPGDTVSYSTPQGEQQVEIIALSFPA